MEMNTSRPDKIDILKQKYKVDFRKIKAIVNSNDIDEIIKQPNGVLMIGTRIDCNKWMSRRFSAKPNAKIIMRDVEALDPETKEVYLGDLSK